MYQAISLASLSLLAVVSGQNIGTNMPETHPTITTQKCTTAGGCTNVNGQIVLDANWRWTHNVGGTTNCYTGNEWDATLCPDDVTCAANCAIDGAEYQSTYGISTTSNALTLDFVTVSQQPNIGSRTYLMASNTEYQIFNLLNQEFTFTVDVSQLPCGLNGALYFVQMAADGGLSEFPGNKAGAQYGTGYCDSQCPQDIKFINGQANSEGWVPSATDPNAGTGNFGTCCNEMDIWEANSFGSAYTPHVCSIQGQTRCEGDTQCGVGTADRQVGLCDKDGCDFNSWRMGNHTFFGPGLTVNTNEPITVVTQFITNTGTATGTLSAIKRIYVQNGVEIQNSFTDLAGISPAVNDITDTFCNQQKAAVGDPNTFEKLGGLGTMSTALKGGMVLVMSLWDDQAANMLWLDSTYPPTAATTAPGVSRGPCAPTSGVPGTVQSQSPNAKVIFSNIKVGDIGSTFTGTTTGPSPPTSPTSAPAPPPTTSPTSGTVAEFGQCGGEDYTGPTVCVSPFTCQELNPFFFQCLTAA